MERFADFADLAEKHGLKLIVGLLTGWMSGRLFVPPALRRPERADRPGRHPVGDALRALLCAPFQRAPRHRWPGTWATSATAWGRSPPGRQPGCGPAITNAIRVEDSSRPVVSGMHGLSPGRDDAWTMQDQGELTDLLTTHPYPYFTPHCDQDPVNTIRTILHSTAESRFYADIGGKPCLVEEIGTLGPMLASEAVAADFVRSCCSRCGRTTATDCCGGAPTTSLGWSTRPTTGTPASASWA